jgi:hypothetical protein
MATENMLAAHPQKPPYDLGTFARAIEESFHCAQDCLICADACLAENSADLLACIRTCQDCAEICQTTGTLLARPTLSNALLQAQLKACLTACSECAGECERHAQHHEHCAICAESCRSCERICQSVHDLISA